jgi:hypothetical protein
VAIKKAKAKGKGKEAANKGAKESAESKKAANVIEVRQQITELVTEAAVEIATGVIAGAKSGQLASAKYLFEVAGLYPPTEETAPPLPEHSLAHTLLRRLGLPTEPVIRDEDQVPAALAMGWQPVRRPVRVAVQDADEEPSQSADPTRGNERERSDGTDAVE